MCLCVCVFFVVLLSRQASTGQVAKIPRIKFCFICNRLELCILWYVAHVVPFGDATAITVWINPLSVVGARRHFHRALLPWKSCTVFISCLSSSSDIHLYIYINIRSIMSHSLLSAFFICSFNTWGRCRIHLPSQHCIVLFNFTNKV